ncbi:MAG: hypothetical protein AB8H79_02775, partial [Myxococcota bacterium]
PEGDAGPVGPSGTVATFLAIGDAGSDGPNINGQLYSFPSCFTESYRAGEGEVAIVTASVGLELSGSLQGHIRAAHTVNGGAVQTAGNYFIRDMTNVDVVVFDRIELTEGSTYTFGSGYQLQGASASRERLRCQTQVTIVREAE